MDRKVGTSSILFLGTNTISQSIISQYSSESIFSYIPVGI